MGRKGKNTGSQNDEDISPINFKFHRPGQQRDVLRKMRAIPETFDIEFMVGGELFPAHRSWVATASPILCTMLTNGMKESVERKVVIQEVNAGTWKTVMDYIYFEDVHVDSVDDGLQLLECARRFEITELQDEMLRYLTSAVDETNCCEMVVHANTYHLEGVKAQALEVIGENFYNVCSTLSIGVLDIDSLEWIVKRQDLQIQSELNIVQAISKWLMINGHVTDQSQASSNDKDVVPRAFTINRLTDCVKVDKLQEKELKKTVRLCALLKLEKLYTACLDALLGNEALKLDVSTQDTVYSRHEENPNDGKPRQCNYCNRSLTKKDSRNWYCNYCGRSVRF